MSQIMGYKLCVCVCRKQKSHVKLLRDFSSMEGEEKK